MAKKYVMLVNEISAKFKCDKTRRQLRTQYFLIMGNILHWQIK